MSTDIALMVEVGDELAHDPWFSDWLREQGIDPDLTFRVVFVPGAITAHRYKPGADGKPFMQSDEFAVDEPLRVPFTEPLPDRIVAAARQI